MKLQRTHRPPQCEDTMRKEMSCMTNLPLSDTVSGGTLISHSLAYRTIRKTFLFFISYKTFCDLLEQFRH